MTPVVIGLSAVVVAIRDGEAVVLTVRPKGQSESGLPFGPFDPEGHRTFELALRAFVTEQTRFDLGYVEQLYTFGDKGRDAPLADMGAGAARIISVGYLALAPAALDTHTPGSQWDAWSRFFPWEDWRDGRPAAIAPIESALRAWALASEDASGQRLARARLLFALDGAPWNEERVLERYELLYEAGLAPEAARDRGEAFEADSALESAVGQSMISDHRRILATALSRLRGKLKYRPVVFELMPDAFTLSALQRAVEAIAGVPLHKQNFRRALERAELVEGLGRLETETGGRPAELHRFRREILAARPVSGLSLPLLRD
ncbi:NUDIX hydrolase [Phenylobacterium deserti]|uniref:NAD regulator n=1 Tax=Phenylobacterium deserti TaxID=1914756 RepID=A0A328AFU8_9CAUL|nr:NAD regulator [Phenylobacterium deserti]RAK52294.1 NAD regulator [Phenylobacterium deserti]